VTASWLPPSFDARLELAMLEDAPRLCACRAGRVVVVEPCNPTSRASLHFALLRLAERCWEQHRAEEREAAYAAKLAEHDAACASAPRVEVLNRRGAR
jgi:hypothetical protein